MTLTATLPAPAPRIGAAGCIDGLITIATADGPDLAACRGACCRQTCEDARREMDAAAS